jgi:hypothetical protein
MPGDGDVGDGMQADWMQLQIDASTPIYCTRNIVIESFDLQCVTQLDRLLELDVRLNCSRRCLFF